MCIPAIAEFFARAYTHASVCDVCQTRRRRRSLIITRPLDIPGIVRESLEFLINHRGNRQTRCRSRPQSAFLARNESVELRLERERQRPAAAAGGLICMRRAPAMNNIGRCGAIFNRVLRSSSSTSARRREALGLGVGCRLCYYYCACCGAWNRYESRCVRACVCTRPPPEQERALTA